MLNELESSITLVDYYLNWLIKLSSGSLASYSLIIFFAYLVVLEFNSPREKLSITQVKSSYVMVRMHVQTKPSTRIHFYVSQLSWDRH